MDFQNLVQSLIQSGLWDNLNDDKYSFALCAKPYNIHSQLSQFQDIGIVVKDFYTKIIAIANKFKNQNSNVARFLNPILDKAKDGYPFNTDLHLPPIIKVDIIVNQKNELKIVEIDGYNPRGIAYAVLLNNIYGVENKNLLNEINELLKQRNANKLIWLYAERERYYLRSFEYLTKQLYKEFKIETVTQNANEENLDIDNTSHYFIAPWGISKPNELVFKSKLIELHKKDNSKLIFSLKPWLNNKLLLGLPFLENSFFENNGDYNFVNELEAIKKFLPKTSIIHKNYKFENTTNQFLIKEGVSSGHKGVFFNNSTDFSKKLELAKSQKKPSFIIQEEVNQKKFNIDYFEKDGTVKDDLFYCRFIAHFNSEGQLLNVDLTGRNQPIVYGSIDSIQAPCIW